MKTKVSIEIDTDRLASITDEHLASLWYVAQANPVPYDDKDAGEIVECIGREIVRRWLSKTPAPVWNHQGRSYYHSILSRHGKWLPVDGDENNRQWTHNPPAPPQLP